MPDREQLQSPERDQTLPASHYNANKHTTLLKDQCSNYRQPDGVGTPLFCSRSCRFLVKWDEGAPLTCFLLCL